MAKKFNNNRIGKCIAFGDIYLVVKPSKNDCSGCYFLNSSFCEKIRNEVIGDCSSNNNINKVGIIYVKFNSREHNMGLDVMNY